MGLVSHSGSRSETLGCVATGLVDLEVDLDVEIDGDGSAIHHGGFEFVLLYRINGGLVE